MNMPWVLLDEQKSTKDATDAEKTYLLYVPMNRIAFQVRSSVCQAMRRLSIKHFDGAAPPGHLENELSLWIEFLKAK